jgi:cbb3-type cytochrome oxidase subunit 3
MIFTLVAAVMSVVLTILNYRFHFLSARAGGAMAFGMFFWLVIFWGYRADYKQRQLEEDASRLPKQSTPPGN